MNAKRLPAAVAWLLVATLALMTACASQGGSGDQSAADRGNGQAVQPGGSGDTTGQSGQTSQSDPAGPPGQAAAGQAPADFPLPVYANWMLTVDQEETSSRTVIFRYEGERGGVMEQYADDLKALGLDVTIDGFRIIAAGDVQGEPLDAQIVFQQGSGFTAVTFSLKRSGD